MVIPVRCLSLKISTVEDWAPSGDSKSTHWDHVTAHRVEVMVATHPTQGQLVVTCRLF